MVFTVKRWTTPRHNRNTPQIPTNSKRRALLCLFTGAIIAKPSHKSGGATVRRGIHNSAKTEDENSGTSLTDEFEFLDLFSTSQTFEGVLTENETTCAAPVCMKNAPYFAYNKHEKVYGVIQGCCNSWNCPRCGIMRAKQEYGRIVQGCKTLSENNELWFITISCRGKEMTVNEAHENYGKWTNKLLTTWRTYAARHNQIWTYASVTEHQKRGHPHSHILTTWKPPKIYEGKSTGYSRKNDGSRDYTPQTKILSDYVRKSIGRAGFGEQYDISRVQSSEAASRYVAKYLFKPTIFSEKWPSGWKRVRYSNSFPRLPKMETDAFVLLTREDWRKLGNIASLVTVDDYIIGEIVKHHIPHTEVLQK